MTIGELYKKVVELGINGDPRSKADLNRFMNSRKEEHKKLKTKEEKELQKDKLWNPYDDTRVVYGDLKRKVNVVFVGIDIETQDLLLIDRINQKRMAAKKKPIDLAMAHHPEGYALGGLSGVMEDIQVEILKQAGVPVNITEKVISSRVRDVGISVASDNLHRTMESAKLLDIPMLCCHTAADNNAYQIIKQVVEKAKPYKLQDVVDALKKVPVYKEAAKHFENSVTIQVGSPESRAGKIMVGGF